jgi:hypothetical protein
MPQPCAKKSQSATGAVTCTVHELPAGCPHRCGLQATCRHWMMNGAPARGRRLDSLDRTRIRGAVGSPVSCLASAAAPARLSLAASPIHDGLCRGCGLNTACSSPRKTRRFLSMPLLLRHCGQTQGLCTRLEWPPAAAWCRLLSSAVVIAVL